ncbi:MAG: ECF-type sigma factor [Verrucomicrobiales bacterium]|nr:ECF-type sigma factor [Verrucomicrobiales bacterium]
MLPSSSDREPSEPARNFRTTHWSVVLLAGQADLAQSAQALEILCRTYWYPVYSFIRHKGYDVHETHDLTQAFFARLIEKNYVEAADSEKGKFRTFLLTAVTRFLANEQDRAHALKRGGGDTALSLDEEDAEGRFLHEPIHGQAPDKLYDQAWARQVLSVVLDRLRAEFDRAGRTNRFEELKTFLVDDKGALSYAEAAARLGLTPSAVKTGIHRLRQRYAQLIREEIAQTVDDPAQVETEIQYLIDALTE